jgi:hypothetical protein
MHLGGGVALDRCSGLCARMCLACAFDLISPSVHSWHQKALIGVVSAHVVEELGSAEQAGTQARSMPSSATDNGQHQTPANMRLRTHCVTCAQEHSSAEHEE